MVTSVLRRLEVMCQVTRHYELVWDDTPSRVAPTTWIRESQGNLPSGPPVGQGTIRKLPEDPFILQERIGHPTPK